MVPINAHFRNAGSVSGEPIPSKPALIGMNFRHYGQKFNAASLPLTRPVSDKAKCGPHPRPFNLSRKLAAKTLQSPSTFTALRHKGGNLT